VATGALVSENTIILLSSTEGSNEEAWETPTMQHDTSQLLDIPIDPQLLGVETFMGA
jgi:hypothetical protein